MVTSVSASSASTGAGDDGIGGTISCCGTCGNETSFEWGRTVAPVTRGVQSVPQIASKLQITPQAVRSYLGTLAQAPTKSK